MLIRSAVVAFAVSASLLLSSTSAEVPATQPSRVGDLVAPRHLPGDVTDGAITLPNGWSLKPAGRQVALGHLPLNLAVSPSGKFVVALNCGMRDHELTVVDAASNKVVARAVVDQAFYGLTFSPDGKKLFVAGSETQCVWSFDFSETDGLLSGRTKIDLTRGGAKGVAAGLAIDAEGKTLYVADTFAHGVHVVPLDNPSKRTFVPTGELSYPYAVTLDHDGKRLFVSLWGKSSLAVFDPAKPEEAPKIWQCGSHPTEMIFSPDGKTLYVSCADTTSVRTYFAQTGEPLETIACSLYPSAPSGNTPASLALSPDGKTLFVADANANNIAVIDVSLPGHARPRGFIPVGWYPSAVRVSPDGLNLFISNAKGGSSLANPLGPQPGRNARDTTVDQYSGRLLTGTMSNIRVPTDAQLRTMTATVYASCPLRPDLTPRLTPEKGNPIPAKVGDESPIKHCLYIIKENRTYDQVLGDLPQGNGDARLCLFPRNVSTNHHELAEQFVLLDNFYVDAEVSAQGHEWSTAAIASDFVEKMWPQNYRKDGHDTVGYPAEGNYDSIARPSTGYIWDDCAKKNVTYISFGEWVNDGANAGDPNKAAVKALQGHIDPTYKTFDLDYPDQGRADRYIEVLKGWEQTGEMPRFQVIRLGNDHTSGTKVGAHTPQAMVADNDLALGRIVEAVSHSKFWKDTAIFVVEDDAQNGPDHVDAHRTVALVVSPYTRRKAVDSTMYSTSSMLRTMELILGLDPMTPFDAAAAPMYASFQEKPDLTPYQHVMPIQSLEDLNLAGAWGADFMAKADLSKEDAIDDLAFSEVIWKGVKGAESEMPRPVRAAFVRPIGSADADDDDDRPRHRTRRHRGREAS